MFPAGRSRSGRRRTSPVASFTTCALYVIDTLGLTIMSGLERRTRRDSFGDVSFGGRGTRRAPLLIKVLVGISNSCELQAD